jgi:predicted dehydrogenase
MMYFPGPAMVKNLVKSNKYGKVINFTYYTGQYLPDWHPWEDISEFYVSSRETGGCREIVPFELTWLNDIFGYPDVLSSTKTKLSCIDADIDDIYQITLRYPDRVMCSLIVDVIARPKARREMFINLEKGQIVFSAHENCVRHIGVDSNNWAIENLPSGSIEDMYINPEEPYIQEMHDFLTACKQADQRFFPNSLIRDWTVLNLLSTIDRSSISF